MDKETLEEVLDRAWCKETSSEKDWTHANPAQGQCAVTAVVVQDYFGGHIINANAIMPDNSKPSHYWNVVDGEEIDLTRKQFPKGTIIPPGASKRVGRDGAVYASTRDYILSFETTRVRYETLKARVDALLAK